MTHKEFNQHYGHNAPCDKLTKDGEEFLGACNGLSFWYKIFRFTKEEVIQIEAFASEFDEESNQHDTPAAYLAIAAGYSLAS